MSSFCTQCGQQVDSDDLFCAHCGKPIKNRSASSALSPETWEYREFSLDFSKLSIQRSTIHPMARFLDTGQPEIPLASLYWECSANNRSDWSLENLYHRFCRDIWWYIEPLVTNEVNALAAQGWQLTTTLDYHILESSQLEKSPTLNLLRTLGDAYFGYNGPSPTTYFVSLTGARLPMRRRTRGAGAASPQKEGSPSSDAIDSSAQQTFSPQNPTPAKRQLPCALIYRGHSNWVCAIAWSPDSRLLASSGKDCVHIWEAATGRCQMTYPDFLSGGTLEWLADGTHLLVARDRVDAEASFEKRDSTNRDSKGIRQIVLPRVDIWETATGTCRFQYIAATKDEYMAWSPDGSRFAATIANSVQIWSTSSQHSRLTLPDHDVSDIVWSPTGKWLAGRVGTTILFWDSTTGARWWSHSLPKDRLVSHPTWSPDGQFLACISDSEGYWKLPKSNPASFFQVHLFNVLTKTLVQTYIVGSPGLSSLLWSADSRFLFSVCDRETRQGVSVCEVRSLTHQLIPFPEIFDLDEMYPMYPAMACAPDTGKLAVAFEQKGVQIWNMVTKEWSDAYTAPLYRVGELAWSPNGKVLAAIVRPDRSSAPKEVHLLQIETM